MKFNPINKYPSNLFIILLIIGITFSFNLFGALLVITSNYLHFPINEKLVQGMAQLLFLFGATVLISKIIPLKFKVLFRLEHNIEFKYLFYGVVGLLFLNLFNTGYVSFQEHLIPKSLKPLYNDYNALMESIYDKMLRGKDVYDFILALLVGAIIPAISEEFLFRGFGQRSLEEKNSVFFAVMVTGTLFGIIHFNFINLLPLILIGVFLGYLAYYSKSILVPIFIHFLNNAFSILLFYIDEPKAMSSDIKLDFTISVLYTLIGLLGVIGMIIFLSRFGNSKIE